MKKRKIFKKISLAGLAACMFCLPILAGCAPAEMLPQNPTQGQNFDLGLNPETDPVVYTTASGLQIKKSGANISNTSTFANNAGYSFTQDLKGFYYFTMGKVSGSYYTGVDLTTTATYTNQKINWLIIGRGEMAVADSTPAGSAIQGDAGKQEIAMGSSIYENLNLSAIPENSEIPKGCFLVLSEKCIGQSYFNSKGGVNGVQYVSELDTDGYLVRSTGGNFGNRYRYIGDIAASTNGSQTWSNKSDGSLYTYINNLFSKNNSGTILKNNLGFTNEQADLIIPQQLYTYYSNGYGYNHQENPTTDGSTYYTMFPLAYRAAYSSIYQNFCVEDYLNSNARRVTTIIGSDLAYGWWLRSSPKPNSGGSTWNLFRSSYVESYGNCNGCQNSYGLGVRPAMVMKLQ